jgi:hypothetical protein
MPSVGGLVPRIPSRLSIAGLVACLACLAALPSGAAGEARATDRARCDRDLTDLVADGCPLLFVDTAASADPEPIWGAIDCEHADRQERVNEDGDPHVTATGAVQGDESYRRLQVRDGDDFFGERCELGRNDHRHGPTALYREGDRRATFASYRLPEGYPLASERWQVVMQIKQSYPSDNSGGTPVLELEAKRDRWRLLQSNKPGRSSASRELWSAPAERGIWTRFAFDVLYSKKKGKGLIRAFADLNSDGDAADEHERSPKIETFTLKRETGGSNDDGLKPGETIPSHLRVGIYHDPAIDCGESTCAVEVDNVQVVNSR